MSQRSERRPSGEADEGRREALKKLGVYGAYTAPALYALLHSGKAVASSHGRDGQGQNGV